MGSFEVLNGQLKTVNKDVCWIIGGGPSLKPYIEDLQFLFKKTNQTTIATNNAYRIFPESILVHFMDEEWWKWHSREPFNILQNFSGFITTSRVSKLNRFKYPARVLEFIRGENCWLAHDKNMLNGNNTGHQALNLAIHLGFKEIRLLGFDLDAQSPATHWHQEHQRPTNVANIEATILPNFKTVTQETIDKFGTKVYNCNRFSKLDQFEWFDVEQWIQTQK